MVKIAAAVWVVLGVLCATMPALAAEVRVMTDRPDHATSLYTIYPGLAQVETGVSFLRNTSGDSPVRRFAAEGVVRVGLTETTEVSVGGEFLIRERSDGQTTTGFGDMSLAGKWRIVEDEGWRPALGVLPFIKFPTASRTKRLGSGRVDFGAILAAGKDLPGDLHVDVNVGLGAVDLPEDPGGLFFRKTVAASFSWTLTDKISPFWEIFYESRDRPDGHHNEGTDFGVIVTLNRRLALDLGVELGIGGANPDWVLRTGFSVLLGALPN